MELHRSLYYSLCIVPVPLAPQLDQNQNLWVPLHPFILPTPLLSSQAADGKPTYQDQLSSCWHRRGWIIMLRARRQSAMSSRSTNPCCGFWRDTVVTTEQLSETRGYIVHTSAFDIFEDLICRAVSSEEEGLFRSILGYLQSRTNILLIFSPTPPMILGSGKTIMRSAHCTYMNP